MEHEVIVGSGPLPFVPVLGVFVIFPSNLRSLERTALGCLYLLQLLLWVPSRSLGPVD